jgi:hypothetical protein
VGWIGRLALALLDAPVVIASFFGIVILVSLGRVPDYVQPLFYGGLAALLLLILVAIFVTREKHGILGDEAGERLRSDRVRPVDVEEGPGLPPTAGVPRLGSASLSKEGTLSATASFLIFIPGMTILSFLIGAIIMTVAMSDNVEPEDDEAAEAPAAH